MLTAERIERILSEIPCKSVGLLGDLFLDRYLDIDPARDEPSVETGLTAYQVTRVRAYPGALGTVLNNLVALGVGTIHPIAILGEDGEGYELQQALRRMKPVRCDGLIVTAERRTPTYTKPMYGERELNRLDIKNRSSTSEKLEDRVLEYLEKKWSEFDVLLVLDQVSEENCGVVTTRVRERIAELAQRDPGKFVLADSRERISLFRQVCVKPNHRECLVQGHDLMTGGRNRQRECGRTVFCTHGENGLYLFNPDGTHRHVPAYPVSGPIDICGAGDSCSAGIAAAVAAGMPFEEAAAFGNLIASITIQQIGTTGTASPEQIRKRWKQIAD